MAQRDMEGHKYHKYHRKYHHKYHQKYHHKYHHKVPDSVVGPIQGHKGWLEGIWKAYQLPPPRVPDVAINLQGTVEGLHRICDRLK